MRAVCLALGLLVLAPPAWAFECTVGRTCLVSPRWADRVATYRVEAPPADFPLSHAQVRAAVRAAFARWTEVACTDLVAREDPASPHVVRVITRGWPSKAEFAAVTHLEFDSVHGDIHRADIAVNGQFFDYAVDTCGAGQQDLEMVLTHEVGHYIGLAHPCEYDRPEEGTVMEPIGDPEATNCPVESCQAVVEAASGVQPPTILWPTVQGCELARRELAPDDVAGVCSIYPRRALAQACVELPLQPEPYVTNVAFGCAAGGAGGGGSAALLTGLVALAALRIARRRR